MKINRGMLVAVVMMVGATAAMGCKKSEDQSAPQQESAAAEPASTAADQGQTQAPAKKDESATVFAKASVGVQTAPPAPPPERFENPGRPPSREHTWMRGYWRWDTGAVRYVWEPGHWMVQFAPSAPPAPRYEDPGRPPSSRHTWVKGYWKWSGHDWLWVGGHWDTTRNGYTYIAPHWDREHGRWHYMPGRWERNR